MEIHEMLILIRILLYLFYYKKHIDSDLAVLLKIKICHVNTDF